MLNLYRAMTNRNPSLLLRFAAVLLRSVSAGSAVLVTVGVTLCVTGCNDVGDSTAPAPSACPTATVGDSSVPMGAADTGAPSIMPAMRDSAAASPGPEAGADATVGAGPDSSLPVDGAGPLDGTSADHTAADGAADATLPTGASDASGEAAEDTGPAIDSAIMIDAATLAAELTLVQKYNPAATAVTATEQAFFDKDITNGSTSFDCTNCLLTNDCLHNAGDGITMQECEDVVGNAAAGAQTGTSRTQLCLAVTGCILGTDVAAGGGEVTLSLPDGGDGGASTCAVGGDSTICYCGAANVGNACQTIARGVGPCAEQEADALEFAITDPVDILANFIDPARGGGAANAIFACAVANDLGTACGTCWQ